MAPLVIVDGHNLLWRAHFGFPARVRDSHGLDITGVFGFFALLRATLQALGEELDCVVCFDGQMGTASRREVSDGYKDGRANGDLTPITHLVAVKAGLDAISIPWMEFDAIEADDLVATVCSRHRGREIVIFSTDRDFYQLIDEMVSVNGAGRSAPLVTMTTVVEKFGVHPKQWCDFRAMTGDPSDNIRGVPGVGPKRAAKMLENGKTLEHLLSARLTVNSMHERVLRDRDDILLRKRLLTLDGTLDVDLVDPARVTAPIPLAKTVLQRISLW